MLEALWAALRVLLLYALLFALPLGAGLAFWPDSRRGAGTTFIYGVCVSLALFELIYLPFLFFKPVLSALAYTYAAALLLLAALGFWRFRRGGAALFVRPTLSRREKYLALAAAALVLMQALRMVICVTDLVGDDSFYLAVSLDALDSDTLWRCDAETGRAGSMVTDYQYSLAPWPVFIAVLSRLADIHPAILCRTLLPAPLTVLFYLVLWLLFRRLFGGDVRKTLIALILAAAYTNLLSSQQAVKYFWMAYLPWYGKAVAPSILCPAALVFLLPVLDGDGGDEKLLWLGGFFAAVAVCMTAASGTVMLLVMLFGWGLAALVRRRECALIWKLALVASPCAAQLAACYLL